MATHLRLFPASYETEDFDVQAPTVRIRLADLLPLLAIAKKNNYLWLQDFLDDEVTVTPDLYDVLRSFSTVQKTPA